MQPAGDQESCSDSEARGGSSGESGAELSPADMPIERMRRELQAELSGAVPSESGKIIMGHTVKFSNLVKIRITIYAEVVKILTDPITYGSQGLSISNIIGSVKQLIMLESCQNSTNPLAYGHRELLISCAPDNRKQKQIWTSCNE